MADRLISVGRAAAERMGAQLFADAFDGIERAFPLSDEA